MKIRNIFLSLILLFASLAASTQNDRLVSEKSHIRFFSTTPAEDIEANNYSATSTLNTSNGQVAFVVPMQGFQFEKALMQKHFNQKNFLDTKSYPEGRLVARITNLDNIDFGSDGSYPALVEGELTIRGVTNPISENGMVIVKDGVVHAESTFDVTLADYGIEFMRGKPASNIAKTIEVTVKAEYTSR
jgi:polyisoprenoid-binding protein YceI